MPHPQCAELFPINNYLRKWPLGLNVYDNIFWRLLFRSKASFFSDKYTLCPFDINQTPRLFPRVFYINNAGYQSLFFYVFNPNLPIHFFPEKKIFCLSGSVPLLQTQVILQISLTRDYRLSIQTITQMSLIGCLSSSEETRLHIYPSLNILFLQDPEKREQVNSGHVHSKFQTFPQTSKAVQHGQAHHRGMPYSYILEPVPGLACLSAAVTQGRSRVMRK